MFQCGGRSLFSAPIRTTFREKVNLIVATVSKLRQTEAAGNFQIDDPSPLSFSGPEQNSWGAGDQGLSGTANSDLHKGEGRLMKPGWKGPPSERAPSTEPNLLCECPGRRQEDENVLPI